jgi:hypothetical protein
MNRNDRSTMVLGVFALTALLTVTVPATAMNDPVTGRWITRDPLYYGSLSYLNPRPGGWVPLTAPQERDRLNLYEAMRDDPVNRTDADGRRAIGFPCPTVPCSCNGCTPFAFWEVVYMELGQRDDQCETKWEFMRQRAQARAANWAPGQCSTCSNGWQSAFCDSTFSLSELGHFDGPPEEILFGKGTAVDINDTTVTKHVCALHFIVQRSCVCPLPVTPWR